MKYGMFCEMLPKEDGVRHVRMGSETYETLVEAKAACDSVRRQNLPFRAWPVSIADPRPDHAKLTITVDGPQGSDVTRISNYLRHIAAESVIGFVDEIIDMSEVRDGLKP